MFQKDLLRELVPRSLLVKYEETRIGFLAYGRYPAVSDGLPTSIYTGGPL
jgi:hypothetical protein